MKFVTQLLESLWGIYAWLIFLICTLIALLLVTIVPVARARCWSTGFVCRTTFLLCGVRVSVIGRDRLPSGHAVVVANHSSYIDGPLLKGHLPARFSFVIKGEMRNIPIVHFLLRRAGSHFVERFTAAGSRRDARQIVKAAQDGQSLVFFPEGTFVRTPGVGNFRPGAFVAATRGAMPLVPVAISGTRRMLAAGRLLPRPGRLRIEFLPAILPDDPVFQDHRQLADLARQQIRAAIRETASSDPCA
ncbi:MAG TPA: lysophospholipid acyltransferase family protein [Woeseiaceae bacterium]|nr:lysophospholipid acyltransferase family protein [Woeseiaceae bacterium]